MEYCGTYDYPPDPDFSVIGFILGLSVVVFTAAVLFQMLGK